MKSWIILIVLAVTLTAAFTVAMPLISTDSLSSPTFPAPAKPDGPAPVVEVVESMKYDFGTLPQEFTGHHSWTFKNAGAGPLELRGATTTCSCTTADLFKETTAGGAGKDAKSVVIKPGETFPIDVTFLTKKWDHFHQSVTVATNDPSKPTVTLAIDGEVKPAVMTYPADPGIGFGPVNNEGENKRGIALWSIDRPEMKVLKATSTNPDLIAVVTRPMEPEEAKKIGAPGKAISIEVTLKPTSHLGAFAEEVRVETDHPQKSELRFKVMGKVTGPITLVPEKITIRGATTTTGGTEFLKIIVRGRTKVDFTVEKKPKDLELSIERMPDSPGAKGSMYKMVAKLSPGSDSSRIVDEIMIKTDDPAASELKVPVDILVQGTK